MAGYWPDENKTVRVTVQTVDPRTRQVHAALKDGVVISLAVWETPAFFRWPRENEDWTAIYESGFWRLGWYIGETDTAVTDLLPGEGRVDVSKLYIAGQTFVLGQAVVLTNDVRLNNSRAPTGPAGGVLTGTYPNPTFAVDMATQVELTDHAALTTTAHGGIVASTDPRLADARAPTGPAGGILAGTYPNPSFAQDMATQVELDASNATIAAHEALTTTAHGGIVASTDPRLTNSRTPSGPAGGVLSGTFPDPGFAIDMATQSELDIHTANTTNPHSVTKAQVGLANADNTSDVNKPVSTAQQAALDLKAPVASPAFTGTVTIDGDTNLYRSGINTLRTDDDFYANFLAVNVAPTTDTVVLRLGTNGASNPQLRIEAGGKFLWADGIAVPDTNLYRQAANILQTDGSFYIRSGAFAVFANTTDVNSKFYIAPSNGALNWGAGGASGTDINLYRRGANSLKTDDELEIGLDLILNNKLYFDRATLDTNLYRRGANQLATDDALWAEAPNATNGVGGHHALRTTGKNRMALAIGTDEDSSLYLATDFTAALRMGGSGVAHGDFAYYPMATDGHFKLWRSPGAVGTTLAALAVDRLFIGAADTNLYRDSPAFLRTNATTFFVSGRVIAQDASGLVSLNDTANGIRFGLTEDTNLYRGAANLLQTDDRFYAVGSRIDAGDNMRARFGTAAEINLGDVGPGGAAGLLFGSAFDTNLYRIGPNGLKTDDSFYAGHHLVVGENDAGGAGAMLFFGQANDTNLYRSAANTLKTDDAFHCLSLTQTSDATLKKGVETIPDALATIRQIRGVEFHWKDSERFQAGKQRGFIAQELQKVLPETIVSDGEELGIAPLDIIPVLVEAIKQLDARIQLITHPSN